MYFAPYIDETGLHMPTYEDRLEALLQDYRRIFSTSAVLSPAVPDYQLLSVFARALDDVSALILQDYAARSPLYAQGANLDTFCPLYGITRRGESRSVVQLTIYGIPRRTVPAGSLVADTDGNPWKITENVSLTVAGTLAQAECQTPGAVEAAPGTIRTILTPVAGWTGVNNLTAGGGGAEAETDSELRQRMMNAFDISIGPAEAIRRGIMVLPGVTDCTVWVNDTGEATADGMPAHSIQTIVEGGTDAEIGRVIFEKKAPGIRTHGDVSVSVADAWNVSREVHFSRPTLVAVSLAVVLSGAPSEAARQALTTALANRLTAMRIGETLYMSSLYSLSAEVLQEEAPHLYVRSIRAMVGQSVSTEVIALPKNAKVNPTAGGINIGY